MADPVFDPVNVPDRADPTARPIDNVSVTDADGNAALRQVVVQGDPVEHELVARVTDVDPRADTPGAVVRVVGTVSLREVEDLLTAILETMRELRDLTELMLEKHY
jgi:hypothetical protein